MKHIHKWLLLDKTKGRVQFTLGTTNCLEDVDCWLVTCIECGEIKSITATSKE